MRWLVALLGAATVLGFGSRWSWFFELGTFFRFQYAVLLAVAAAALLPSRRFRLAAVAAALAALNLVAVVPTWLAEGQPSRAGAATLRAVVANVEYGNDDYDALARVVADERPDVLGITELTPAWDAAIRERLPRYRPVAVDPQPGAYGIGLYARVDASGRIAHLPSDGPPSVVARVPLGGALVTLVVTHPHTPFGPHAGGLHRRQFAALAAARPSFGPRVAICGDLNTPPWSWPFRHLEASGLRDTQRGHPLDASWPTWFPPLRTPIDNCLVSDGVVVLRRETLSGIGSDHLPLLLEIGLARS